MFFSCEDLMMPTAGKSLQIYMVTEVSLSQRNIFCESCGTIFFEEY